MRNTVAGAFLLIATAHFGKNRSVTPTFFDIQYLNNEPSTSTYTINLQGLLSLTAQRHLSHLSLNECLFQVSVSLLCAFLFIYIFMLFHCLSFVLFGRFSAVYVVFPACILSFDLLCRLFWWSLLLLKANVCQWPQKMSSTLCQQKKYVPIYSQNKYR